MLAALGGAACRGSTASLPSDPLNTESLPRVPLTRIWQTGTIDLRSDVSIGRFGPVAFLSDGRLAVADDLDPSIVIFDETGEIRARLGRNGSGPGEFRRIGALAAAPGAGLLVRDVGLVRVTYFSTEARVLTSVLGPDHLWPWHAALPYRVFRTGLKETT